MHRYLQNVDKSNSAAPKENKGPTFPMQPKQTFYHWVKINFLVTAFCRDFPKYTKVYWPQYMPALDWFRRYHFSDETWYPHYRKTSSISRILVGNEIIDNSDVVGASPVGAAPTTSSFST